MYKDLFVNTYGVPDLTFESGKGVYLYDNTGKKYLDFVAGIAVNSLGYSNEGFKNALKNQIDKLMHVSNLYQHQIGVTAAEKLKKYSGMDRVFICNSGTEAVEAAIKFARIYGKEKLGKEKFEIISAKNSFHGRTLGALTLTGQAKYQAPFVPLLPGVRHCEYNDITSLKKAITANTCAVILELMQCEGGMIEADYDYIHDVRKLCDELKILLIIDEVQTGVGRSGYLYSYQKYNLKPDIVTTAKGLGGGFPLGATLVTKKVATAITPGTHGSTFGGNLLASTAIDYVLTEVVENGILTNVKQMSKYLFEKLNQIESNLLKNIRGYGLLVGVELTIDSAIIIEKCLEKGLLIARAGTNTFRLVPPLVIKKEDVDQAIAILSEVLATYEKGDN